MKYANIAFLFSAIVTVGITYEKDISGCRKNEGNDGKHACGIHIKHHT